MKTSNSIILFIGAFWWLIILNSCNPDDGQPFIKMPLPPYNQIILNDGNNLLNTFTFDSLNNIKSYKVRDEELFTYNYYNSKLESILSDKSYVYSFKYNSQGLVSEINKVASDGTTTKFCAISYDKKNRICKLVISEKTYTTPIPTLDDANPGPTIRQLIRTTVITYGADGNLFNTETAFIEKNLSNPNSKESRWFRKNVYSGYDNSPNAFTFLSNSFYLQFLVEYENYFGILRPHFFGYIGMSSNNPTIEKIYARSDKETYQLVGDFTYSFDYSNGLVNRIVKKEFNSLQMDITFQYSYK